jgi:hemerythrin
MVASELFKWSDDYSVNIQTIDEQHKMLIELINQLHVAIIEHHGKATAGEVLERLSEYTHNHFMLEERLMSLSHYPEFEAHRQQHQEMSDQLQTLQHKFHDENKPIAFELLYVLKKWLLQHINESDKHFGVHFVKARREQNAALDREQELAPKKNKWWAR